MNRGVITSVTDTTISIGWGASTNASGSQYQAELSTISFVGAATSTIVA
jgi:hypothetical protein